MPDGWDDPKTLEVLTRRLELLRRLRESPAHKRDIIEDLDTSRSTLDRAVSELEEEALVERGTDGVALTASGRLALDWFERFRAGFDDVVDAEDVLAPLSPPSAVDADVVVGGEALLATEPASYRPLERFHAALEDAERYRAVLPSLDDPRHVRLLYEHVVTGDRPAELVVTPELLRTLREEFPRRTSVMGETDGFDLRVGDVPPYALALVEPTADRGPTVYLLVFTESGAVHGSIVNRTPAALRWAEDRFAAVREAADPRTDALTADPDGGVLDPDGGQARAAIGRSLPVSLEREGFVDLDVSYFRDEPVADPTTAWRAGLSLPEVHTGYAVERSVEAGDGARSDDATDSLTGMLRERLEAGENCVLLGPPGSGKSTTCKQVACGWYDDGLGSVLYRQNGRGRPLDSVEDLSMAVDLADGHALVVVEDAVRPDAAAVLEAVDRLGDREDVSFLLDAREHEWRDPPSEPIDAEGLSVEPMPPLSTTDTERIVEQFEQTVDSTVDVPVDHLREVVREEAITDDDEAAAGEVLLLLHRLATYADPLTEDETSLEAAVADVYADLSDDDLAMDVCVLANALNVAGIDVDAGVLYAVADEDEFDAVDAALERLEGRVLFPGGDGAYRTVHESWSVTFLAHLLEAAGEAAAAERFGDCVSSVLSLATEPERRDAFAGRFGAAVLPAPSADLDAWVDDTVRRLYAAGREHPKLAPLFGDGETDTVDLPAACSRSVVERRPLWLSRTFEAAGDYPGAERALGRLANVEPRSDLDVERRLALARVAQGRGDYEESRAAATTVLSWDSAVTGSDARERARLPLAEALLNLGHNEAAAVHFLKVREASEPGQDRRRTARSLEGLGRVAKAQSEFDRAREYYEQAHDIYRELGHRRGMGGALQGLGLVSRISGSYDRAREYHERSLDIFRALGDPHGEADSLGNLGTVAYRCGNYERAREYHEQSLELSRRFDDEQGEAASLNNLAMTLEELGALDEARERYAASLELHEELGLRNAEAVTHYNLGRIVTKRGEYEDARDHYERALPIYRELDDEYSIARTLDCIGEVERLQGEYRAARENHERSIEIAQDLGASTCEAKALVNLGVVALQQHEFDAAREYLQRGLDIQQELGNRDGEARARAYLAALERYTSAYDVAADNLERALATQEDTGNAFGAARCRLERGRLALETGDTELAREQARGARESFLDLGMSHLRARSERLLGRVAARVDGPTEGIPQFEAAVETFVAVGAADDALSTLRELVRACHEAGDDESARDWCRRAEAVLEEAPQPVADQHREWVPDCPDLESER